MAVLALIPAAGKGVRMGVAQSKAFVALADKPLVIHTLVKFVGCPGVDAIVVVVAPEDVARAWQLVEKFQLNKIKDIIAGGPTRQQSVACGLAAAGDPWDIVVIHDGARPLVETELIERAIAAAREFGAVSAAVPATDTVRLVTSEGRFIQRLNRQQVALIQTPQAFQYALIREAHDLAFRQGFTATDDAALVEHMGRPVWMIQGSYRNIKITTPEDLLLAEALIKGS